MSPRIPHIPLASLHIPLATLYPNETNLSTPHTVMNQEQKQPFKTTPSSPYIKVLIPPLTERHLLITHSLHITSIISLTSHYFILLHITLYTSHYFTPVPTSLHFTSHTNHQPHNLASLPFLHICTSALLISNFCPTRPPSHRAPTPIPNHSPHSRNSSISSTIQLTICLLYRPVRAVIRSLCPSSNLPLLSPANHPVARFRAKS